MLMFSWMRTAPGRTDSPPGTSTAAQSNPGPQCPLVEPGHRRMAGEGCTFQHADQRQYTGRFNTERAGYQL